MTIPEVEIRQAVRADLAGVREVRSVPFEAFEMREAPNGTGGTVLNFDGYASATEKGYRMVDAAGEYEEIVHRGSFTKTLDDGADAAFLINHQGLTLARTKSGTMRLEEDGIGLASHAGLDPRSVAVQELRLAYERKDVDEMSFAFRVTRQEWSDDWTERHIREVNLNQGDVSVVNYGANPATAGLMAMRRLAREGLTQRALMVAFTELRAGKTISVDNEKILTQVLTLCSAADDAMDDAQPMLAALLGVPNPDADETPDGSEQEAKSASTLSLNRNRARLAGVPA